MFRLRDGLRLLTVNCVFGVFFGSGPPKHVSESVIPSLGHWSGPLPLLPVHSTGPIE